MSTHPTTATSIPPTPSNIVDGEVTCARIYRVRAMTLDDAMASAITKHGLSGECHRAWPASYLATHIVEDGGHEPLEGAKARAVAALLAMGWVERIEQVIEVPADNERYSMFRGTPAP
jgi:hypothetical protein